MERLMALVLVFWLFLAPVILLVGSPPMLNYDIDQDYAIQYVVIRWTIGMGVIFLGSLILGCWKVLLAIAAIGWGFKRILDAAHEEYLENERIKAMRFQHGI